MLHILKEAVDFTTTPSNLLLLLALVALIALVLRWRRLALSCLTLSVVGFFSFGYTFLGEFLIAPLVTRFPPVDLNTAPAPFGIIVLGSGLNEVHAAHNAALMELESGGETVPTAALLARRYPDTRIILSGGHGDGTPPPPLHQADGMGRLMVTFGIAPDRITLDRNSSDTQDRIDNTLALVGDNRDKLWWVITPAHRMPRVMGTYHKSGFHPVAYPIDFKWIPPFDPRFTYALLDGLELTDAAVHEWRGLVLYYLTGKIDTLFPGPVQTMLDLESLQ